MFPSAGLAHKPFEFEFLQKTEEQREKFNRSVAHLFDYSFLFIFYPQFLTYSSWITNVERGREGGKMEGRGKKVKERRGIYSRELRKGENLKITIINHLCSVPGSY